MKLIFVGDPMCSWCYGFGKELSALMARHPDLELEIVVGGVRAGATDVLDRNGKEFRLGHWTRVEAASGLPFNREAFMARENFVYDTEPVCRAVVAAHMLAPEANQLHVFRALQHAFYVDGLDTTDGLVLADVAAAALRNEGHAISAVTFLATWQSAEMIAATLADFRRARAMGVTSFPHLLLETSAGRLDVSPGYAHVHLLDSRLSTLLARFAPPSAASSNAAEQVLQ